MSDINKVSCRLYLDGQYMPFYDTNGDAYYMPSSHDQDALQTALHDLLRNYDIKNLGNLDVECMYYDDEDEDDDEEQEINDIVITHDNGRRPFPQAWLTKYMNKSFQIHPPHWGQDPWGLVFVEIVPFKSPPPTKFPESIRQEFVKQCKDERIMLQARLETLNQTLAQLTMQGEDRNVSIAK